MPVRALRILKKIKDETPFSVQFFCVYYIPTDYTNGCPIFYDNIPLLTVDTIGACKMFMLIKKTVPSSTRRWDCAPSFIGSWGTASTDREASGAGI